jgi:hypothetical protein
MGFVHLLHVVSINLLIIGNLNMLPISIANDITALTVGVPFISSSLPLNFMSETTENVNDKTFKANGHIPTCYEIVPELSLTKEL